MSHLSRSTSLGETNLAKVMRLGQDLLSGSWDPVEKKKEADKWWTSSGGSRLGGDGKTCHWSIGFHLGLCDLGGVLCGALIDFRKILSKSFIFREGLTKMRTRMSCVPFLANVHSQGKKLKLIKQIFPKKRKPVKKQPSGRGKSERQKCLWWLTRNGNGFVD